MNTYTSFEAANAAADRVAIKIINEAAQVVAGRVAAISYEADVVIVGVNEAVIVIVEVD